MKEQVPPMLKIHDLEEYYVTRHLEMIKQLGLKSIIWHDPIDYGVDVQTFFIQLISKVSLQIYLKTTFVRRFPKMSSSKSGREAMQLPQILGSLIGG